LSLFCAALHFDVDMDVHHPTSAPSIFLRRRYEIDLPVRLSAETLSSVLQYSNEETTPEPGRHQGLASG
jgi:hypothetical protein